MNLICLYIIKYYYYANGDAEIVYGTDSPIKFKTMLSDIQQIFAREDITNCFQKSMEYLFEKKVISQSIYDSENLDDGRELDNNMKLFLSSKGLRLLNCLNENSLLLELLRDDIYMNTKKARIIINEIPLLEDRLLDIFELLSELFDSEREIVKIVIENDQIPLYKHRFGDDFLIKQFLVGISTTIEQYFNDKNKNYVMLMQKLNLFEKRVEEYRHMLR